VKYQTLFSKPSDQHRSKASTLLVDHSRQGRSLLVGGIPSMRIRVSFLSLPPLQGNQLEHTSEMAPNPPYAVFAANGQRHPATQCGIPTEVKGRQILPRRKLPLLGRRPTELWSSRTSGSGHPDSISCSEDLGWPMVGSEVLKRCRFLRSMSNLVPNL
jgi:hypothetical protein